MQTPQPPCTLLEIPTSQCQPHEANRKTSSADIAELADSIRAVGLIYPIKVRKTGEHFEIIVGERRWRAHKAIGAKTVAAFVYEDCDDLTVDTLRLVENQQRVESTALQTARELRRLKNLHGLTYEGVAERSGIPLDRVKRYLSIFNASDDVLDAIERHNLNSRTAVALVRYERALGERKTRSVVKRVASGELTSRGLDALRKRANGSGVKAKPSNQPDAKLSSPKASSNSDRWARAEALLEILLKEDSDRLRKLIGPLVKSKRSRSGALAS